MLQLCCGDRAFRRRDEPAERLGVQMIGSGRRTTLEHGETDPNRAPPFLSSNLTIAGLRQMVSNGNSILTEHTSHAHDAAMNARAQSLLDTNDSRFYNAATCNCDQFVKDVLGAADPKAADILHVVPKDDFLNLMVEGFKSGHAGSSPNGFQKMQ